MKAPFVESSPRASNATASTEVTVRNRPSLRSATSFADWNWLAKSSFSEPEASAREIAEIELGMMVYGIKHQCPPRTWKR